MSISVYEFRLRPDMPQGYRHNEQHPELPVILEYLTPFDGQSFKSIEAFKERVLRKFLPYLKKKKIPRGLDPLLRKGLDVEKLAERYDKMNFDYFVFTPATNSPGKCVFGGLEKSVLI